MKKPSLIVSQPDCLSLQIEIVALKQQLAEMTSELDATRDELKKSQGTCRMTGLLNKPRIYQEIEHHLAMLRRAMVGKVTETEEESRENIKDSKNFSVGFLDIDHFKELNTKNHVFTDGVLVEFAHFLRAIVREEDVVARWGGDEFLLLALGTTFSECELLCQKIQKRMADYWFTFGQEKIKLTFSFGIASTSEKNQSTSTVESLVQISESRMKKQKSKKKKKKSK